MGRGMGAEHGGETGVVIEEMRLTDGIPGLGCEGVGGGPSWRGAPGCHAAKTKAGRFKKEAVLIVEGVRSFGSAGAKLGDHFADGFGLGVSEHGCGSKGCMVVGDGEVAESRRSHNGLGKHRFAV